MEVFLVQLIDQVRPRVTHKTGGTSKGDPGAGMGKSGQSSVRTADTEITIGDRAGAGILTAAIIAVVVSGIYVMLLD